MRTASWAAWEAWADEEVPQSVREAIAFVLVAAGDPRAAEVLAGFEPDVRRTPWTWMELPELEIARARRSSAV